jgi:ribose transport system permease protein
MICAITISNSGQRRDFFGTRKNKLAVRSLRNPFFKKPFDWRRNTEDADGPRNNRKERASQLSLSLSVGPISQLKRDRRPIMALDSPMTPVASARIRFGFAKPNQEQIVLLITVVLLVVFGLTLDGFATVSNLLNLLRSISILGVLGLGMGLIVISRGIDLSEVAIMAGSWSIALIEIQNGMPVLWAVLVALMIALSIGVINGIMVAFVEAPALFVTLAAGFVIYGLAFWFAPAWVVYAPKDAPGLLFLGAGRILGIPVPIFVFAAAALAMQLFLSRTSIGRFIYAQGDNPEAARLSGIPLRPLIVLEYVLVGLLAWLAGFVWVGTTGSMQMAITQGTMIFDVVLVVVIGGISLIGGRGGVLSVIVGCVLIGTLLNAFTIMDVNSEVQNIVKGIVLLAAIVLDNWLHPRDEETARQGD